MLRKEVNRLQIENNKLEASIDKLGTQVSSLKESEEKLDTITKEQGITVDKLVGLVKENGKIQAEMNDILRRETLQDILEIVLQSDFDQSYDIGSEEVDMLHMRLKLDPRFAVDEEKLRSMANQKPVPIRWIIENFTDKVPLEDRVFYLKEEKEKLDAEAAAKEEANESEEPSPS